MYSAQVLDHFQHPRFRGRLPRPTGSGEARYEPCGDWMRLEVRVADDRVVEASFDARGCGVALAAGSAGVELILGTRSVVEARRLTAFDLDRALGGVPPPKRHALLMFLDCLAGALGPRDKAKDS